MLNELLEILFGMSYFTLTFLQAKRILVYSCLMAIKRWKVVKKKSI